MKLLILLNYFDIKQYNSKNYVDKNFPLQIKICLCIKYDPIFSYRELIIWKNRQP